jgi:hypothetical protein
MLKDKSLPLSKYIKVVIMLIAELLIFGCILREELQGPVSLFEIFKLHLWCQLSTKLGKRSQHFIFFTSQPMAD